jgi:hypothetical protein
MYRHAQLKRKHVQLEAKEIKKERKEKNTNTVA